MGEAVRERERITGDTMLAELRRIHELQKLIAEKKAAIELVGRLIKKAITDMAVANSKTGGRFNFGDLDFSTRGTVSARAGMQTELEYLEVTLKQVFADVTGRIYGSLNPFPGNESDLARLSITARDPDAGAIRSTIPWRHAEIVPKIDGLLNFINDSANFRVSTTYRDSFAVEPFTVTENGLEQMVDIETSYP